jgi:uncharacterized membrane protein
MSTWWKLVGFGIAVAVLAHVGTVLVVPNAIMSIAMTRIGETAGGTNKLYHTPKVTPQNQTIVRPSPDLAYSICALDLSKGPVRAFIGKGSDYASAAIYGANTDNVFTLNDRQIGTEGARLLIVGTGAGDGTAAGETLVRVHGTRALLLVRRLAPSDDAFARVQRERAGDTCALVASP